MKLLLWLTLALLPAPRALGDAAPSAPSGLPDVDDADGKPAPELLALEKDLAQEQDDENAGRSTPDQYREFVAKFRKSLDDAMARVKPSAANQGVHARILVRLGESTQALHDLNGALEKSPKDPQLLAAKGYVLYDGKDYAGASAAANAALHSDPKNQDALWLKHASEDRSAPPLRLPGSPWGEGPNTGITGGVGARADDGAKPYALAVKVGATPAPPAYSPGSPAPAPSGKTDPLGPLAATGVLLWVAAGIAAKQAQNNAVEAVSGAGEKAADETAGLVQRGKLFAEDHPYITGTAFGGALLLGGAIASPFLGGPSLIALGAGGASVPIAGTASVAAVSPGAIEIAGIGSVALAVGGDKKPLKGGRSRDLPPKGAPNSSDVKVNSNGGGQIREYDAEGNAAKDFDFGHDHGAGDPHVHDWDWADPENPKRGAGRPLRREE